MKPDKILAALIEQSGNAAVATETLKYARTDADAHLVVIRALRHEVGALQGDNRRLESQRDSLQKTIKDGSAPLTDLYRAAEQYMQLTRDTPRRTGDIKNARAKLAAALKAAYPHVDLIPF